MSSIRRIRRLASSLSGQMSPTARLASASGASAAGAAALLLSQRLDGTIPSVVLLAVAARAAGAAVALEGGGLAAAAAGDALRRQVAFVPTWILAAAAACVRAGSSVVGDVAGAHGVAGLALARGPAATTLGMWAILVALAVAAAGSGPAAAVTESASGARGVAVPPRVAARLDLLGFAAQVALIAALVCGPQIRGAADAVPWIAATAGVGFWAWAGRRAARLAAAPRVSAALSAAGVALVVAGGRV